MTGERHDSLPNSLPEIGRKRQRSKVLAVGLTPAQVGSVPTRLFGALGNNVQSVDLSDLSPTTLDEAMVVLSPLLSDGFDAIEVAEQLRFSDFRGRYVVFVSALPNEEMIRTEVRNVAPDLTFDIVETGLGPQLAGE